MVEQVCAPQEQGRSDAHLDLRWTLECARPATAGLTWRHRKAKAKLLFFTVDGQNKTPDCVFAWVIFQFGLIINIYSRQFIVLH